MMDPKHWLSVAQAEARSLGVHDVELILADTSSALTRFANNGIHQNVNAQSGHCSIRVVADHRTARASTNRLDEASIRSVTAQAVALARSSEPDEKLPPLAGPVPVRSAARWSEVTAASSPAARAKAVAEAIQLVESAGQSAAGILSTDLSREFLLNSNGVFLEHAETMSRFSITTTAHDSSGWAKASAVNLRELDTADLARQAMEKARGSAAPRDVEPGAYTVILEPAAVLDLVGQIFGDFSAAAITEGRSFLGGRLGKQLFGANITITDDCFHPLQAGAPFDGEGMARQKLMLVDCGVPREVARSRSSALRDGGEPTGHGLPLPNESGEAVTNIVIHGGDKSIDDMIRSTPRGLLVTRLWYIREVEQFEKIMTGMTRDGTFLIEDGKLVCGVRNFRFNQSVVEMLNNVVMLGPTVRASGEETFDMAVPAMKVDGFKFTEVTKF